MFADFEWALPDLKTQNFLEWFAWPIATALYSTVYRNLYCITYSLASLTFNISRTYPLKVDLDSKNRPKAP